MMQSHTYNCSLWSILLKFVDIAKGTTDLRVVSFCSRECFSIVKNQRSSLVVGFAWFKIVSFGLINFGLVWYAKNLRQHVELGSLNHQSVSFMFRQQEGVADKGRQ